MGSKCRGQANHGTRGETIMGAEATTIALTGATVGIENVFSTLIHSVAQNSSFTNHSFVYAILSFTLAQAIALFVLMMTFFLISFVFRSLEQVVRCGPLVPWE
ncbi:hypothetical protein I3843_04G019100 [Carya illinoinensis]|nr:hypothetical protein I3843_04G019100 [Carya illinoinensis]